jgi:hypothetical protein
MKNPMVFIAIPKQKYPKTRLQLAKDSGKKELTNMNKPVFYADKDSRIVFTKVDDAKEYALSHNAAPAFVEAGRK